MGGICNHHDACSMYVCSLHVVCSISFNAYMCDCRFICLHAVYPSVHVCVSVHFIYSCNASSSNAYVCRFQFIWIRGVYVSMHICVIAYRHGAPQPYHGLLYSSSCAFIWYILECIYGSVAVYIHSCNTSLNAYVCRFQLRPGLWFLKLLYYMHSRSIPFNAYMY